MYRWGVNEGNIIYLLIKYFNKIIYLLVVVLLINV